MSSYFAQVFVLTLIAGKYFLCSGEHYDVSTKMPTVGVSVLVRNKAHTLPYFLSSLMLQDYPKDRMYIWIYSDHNSDKTIEILDFWVETFGKQYAGIYFTKNSSTQPLFEDQETQSQWTPKRYKHVIQLREKALNFARKKWADYIFMLDADVFLTDPDALKHLVGKGSKIVAPMLISDGLYSNFWCDMTEDFYYKRCEDYSYIVRREEDFINCFDVPMVHSAVLISLNHKTSDRLTYNPKKAYDYDGPYDDIITFAVNAKETGSKLLVCNDRLYGFVSIPLDDKMAPERDLEHFVNVKLEAIGRDRALPLHHQLQRFVEYPRRGKHGVAKIYLINLDRRPARRQLMEMSFKELGMDVELITAVDGRKLNKDDLRKMNVRLMPNYEDPYHKRPMKAGEIGCFLSHYNIWEKIVEGRFNMALVLEDDVRFAPFFLRKFKQILEEAQEYGFDLLYLGRKILLDGAEPQTTKHTIRPLYSYWTLGYVLTLRGAKRLLAADPLRNMLPVDEFLPIMFDQHPNETWKSYFPVRNIKALSASPLLINPTHYTGMKGYISDTEDSVVVDTDTLNPLRNDL